jgi:hypothetical protein
MVRGWGQWGGEGESGGSNAQAVSSLPIISGMKMIRRRHWEKEGDNGKEKEKAADQMHRQRVHFP